MLLCERATVSNLQLTLSDGVIDTYDKRKEFASITAMTHTWSPHDENKLARDLEIYFWNCFQENCFISLGGKLLLLVRFATVHRSIRVAAFLVVVNSSLLGILRQETRLTFAPGNNPRRAHCLVRLLPTLKRVKVAMVNYFIVLWSVRLFVLLFGIDFWLRAFDDQQKKSTGY